MNNNKIFKKWVADNHFTQDQAALLLGVSRMTISRYCRDDGYIPQIAINFINRYKKDV